MKRLFVISLMAVLVVGLATVASHSQPAMARSTFYVDDDAPNDPAPNDPAVSDPLEDGSAAHPFDEIQEGIDAAVSGDTVQVASGTYYENIILEDGVQLFGAGADVITIDGSGAGSVVGATDNSTISGFTITNSGVAGL